MEKLKNKKILLFSPSFFGYEYEIKKEIEKFGATVFLYDERPKNDFLTKVIIRINYKALIRKKIDLYYDQILESIKHQKIEYLFLVNPETVDRRVIKKIKKCFGTLHIYVYMWDSLKNRKKSINLLPISDKFFTFDPEDRKFNSRIKFLPLFYIKDYENIDNTKPECIYDLSFIGTVHSDRYKIIKKIENLAVDKGLKTFLFFYSPSRALFYFKKYFFRSFKRINKKDISFTSLSKDKVVDIVGKSKVIIDIQHNKQSGLTIRTIEVLGAKRKLLTTNKTIKKYDFYKENNIQVFDSNIKNLDLHFCKSNYSDIDEKTYKSYSLREWVKCIFE